MRRGDDLPGAAAGPKRNRWHRRDHPAGATPLRSSQYNNQYCQDRSGEGKCADNLLPRAEVVVFRWRHHSNSHSAAVTNSPAITMAAAITIATTVARQWLAARRPAD